MALTRIPDSLRPGVTLLRKMDRPTADAVVSALRSASSPRARDLSAWLTKSVAGLGTSDAAKLAEAIVGLYSRLETSDDPLAEFVTAVTHAATRLVTSDVPQTEFELKLLEDNLRRILDIGHFAALVKAWSLQYENERYYCSARIVTDVRPVFPRDLVEGPTAMLLQHHLKLSHHHGSRELEYFFLTLTDDDLVELKRVIERAEAKARTLRASLSQILKVSESGSDHD